jgi:hypothetical protein
MRRSGFHIGTALLAALALSAGVPAQTAAMGVSPKAALSALQMPRAMARLLSEGGRRRYSARGSRYTGWKSCSARAFRRRAAASSPDYRIQFGRRGIAASAR